MRKVLVFGIGGYLGQPIARKLTSLGYEVTGVDQFWFNKGPDKNEVHRLIQADIRSVDASIFKGQDAVIDVAGLSNDASAEIDLGLTDRINLYGGMRIAGLAKAAGIPRYVYSSSASVYGHGARSGLTEEDEVYPLTGYARSKVSVESYLREISDDNFQPVILRNSTVFGLSPRMRLDLVVNRMTAEAHSKGSVLVEGGGNQSRPLIFIGDAVHVFCRALSPDFAPGTYNVGHNSMNFTIREIAAEVSDYTRTSVVVDQQDSPDQRDYSLNFDKVRKYLVNPVSIRAGVMQIWAALERGELKADDPTTNTLSWYKKIIKDRGGIL